jgi:hypothetical protein
MRRLTDTLLHGSMLHTCAIVVDVLQFVARRRGDRTPVPERARAHVTDGIAAAMIAIRATSVIADA